ncbi:MAG: hypothetical protein E7458_04425 [Ruminococcaceae bacterium]|nr:hypothetical protein [Oscillospiraceae bacterium]
MLFRFNYRSQALGHYVDVSVVIPTNRISYYDMTAGAREHTGPGAIKARPVYHPGMKFQTVYLIHGGGDDDSLTFRYTNVERYAEDNMVMLVVPDVANSFGVDTDYGKNYSTFIAEELPVVIQSLFPSSPAREDNFIVGYAMGGNAALGNAILHPERWAACVDLSGGIGLTPRTEALQEELRSEHFSHFPIYLSTFGPAEDLPGSRHDIAEAVRQGLARGVDFPEIHMVCGDLEFIRARVEADVERFHELGLPVRYTLAEGYHHDFDMWDVYLRKTLAEYLPLKREIL